MTQKAKEVETKVEEKRMLHVKELFSMTFATDKPGEFVGIRLGIQAGTIEFYPKKVE